MIESESGRRESGFRPVQAIADFFVSLLLIGVNIKKVGRGAVCVCVCVVLVTHVLLHSRHTSHVTRQTSHVYSRCLMRVLHLVGYQAKRHDSRFVHHEKGR